MRRSVLGGVALSVLLATSGCGGGDEPGTGAGASTSPSTSASADEESASPAPSSEDPASETPSSDTGSGDTYASATPAAGPTNTTDNATVSAPEGWGTNQTLDENGAILGPTVEYSMELSQSLAGGSSGTTDGLVDKALEFGSYTDAVERLDDVVVAGAPAYHLAGPDECFVDEFGLSVDGQDHRVRVSTPKNLDQAERDALVASIMASFTLTG